MHYSPMPGKLAAIEKSRLTWKGEQIILTVQWQNSGMVLAWERSLNWIVQHFNCCLLTCGRVRQIDQDWFAYHRSVKCLLAQTYDSINTHATNCKHNKPLRVLQIYISYNIFSSLVPRLPDLCTRKACNIEKVGAARQWGWWFSLLFNMWSTL